jgi:hypothetical protein
VRRVRESNQGTLRNDGLSGEFANRPSSRATSWAGTSIVVRQNVSAARLISLYIVASMIGAACPIASVTKVATC